jgi:hypothetical protein
MLITQFGQMKYIVEPALSEANRLTIEILHYLRSQVIYQRRTIPCAERYGSTQKGVEARVCLLFTFRNIHFFSCQEFSCSALPNLFQRTESIHLYHWLSKSCLQTSVETSIDMNYMLCVDENGWGFALVKAKRV